MKYTSLNLTNLKNKLALLTFTTSLLLVTTPVRAVTFALYSPNGTDKPQDQPWLTYTNVPSGLATETVNANGVTLDTLVNNGIYAGYSNYLNPPTGFKNSSFPVLNRSQGYSLDFTVQVLSEIHDGTNGPNRAGFSIIAISNDLRGIELGFWSNEIWAQNVGFTKGESASYNTTTGLIPYRLTIQGNTYTLSANGVSLTNLTNQPLRNYSGSGAPYNLPNFIFLGDDTTSARAQAILGNVQVTTPVPYKVTFSNGILLVAGFWGLKVLKKKLQGH